MLDDLPDTVLERIWSRYFQRYAGALSPEDVASFILVNKQWRSFALEDRNDVLIWKPIAFALCPQCLPQDRASLKYGGCTGNQTWFETCRMCRCWDRSFANKEEEFLTPRRQLSVYASKELPQAMKGVLMVCDADCLSSPDNCRASLPRPRNGENYQDCPDELIQLGRPYWEGETIERLSWERNDDGQVTLFSFEGGLVCSELDVHGHALQHFRSEGHWNYPFSGYYVLRQLEDGSFLNEALSDGFDVQSHRVRYQVHRVEGLGPSSIMDPNGELLPETTKWFLGEDEYRHFTAFGEYLVYEVSHDQDGLPIQQAADSVRLKCLKAGDSPSRMMWDRTIDIHVEDAVLNRQVLVCVAHEYNFPADGEPMLKASLYVIDLETGDTLNILPVLDCPVHRPMGHSIANFAIGKLFLTTDTHVMTRLDSKFHVWNLGTGRKTTLPNPSTSKGLVDEITSSVSLKVSLGPRQSCSHLIAKSGDGDNTVTCWNFITGEIEFVSEMPLYNPGAVFKGEQALASGEGFFLWYELDPNLEHRKYHMVPVAKPAGEPIDFDQPVQRERVRSDPSVEAEESEFGSGLMFLEIEDPDYKYMKQQNELFERIERRENGGDAE